MKSKDHGVLEIFYVEESDNLIDREKFRDKTQE